MNKSFSESGDNINIRKLYTMLIEIREETFRNGEALTEVSKFIKEGKKDGGKKT